MEEKSKIHDLLHNSILKLREKRIEEAISLLSIARKEIITQISLKPIESNMYNLLCQISALIYFAMLHYLALAQKEAKNMNDAVKLSYLSQSLGISNVLDGVVFPLLRTDEFSARKEFFCMIQSGESYKDELRKEIGHLINHLTFGEDKREQRMNESIKKIVNAVNSSSLKIRDLALQLAQRFESGDFKQARKIYEYVRDEIHYMRDPLLFEDVQPPEVTLERSSGDCEDQAILLSSLLLAIGFETALIFADVDNDNVADHVYSAVYIPSAPDIYKPFANKEFSGKDLHDWIPLDPTSEDLDFGVITLNNLEMKHMFVFSKDDQYLVPQEKR